MAEELRLVLTPEQCKDAVYIVTGANTGIGLEVARYLVQLGSAKVILTSRNPSAGAAALFDIEQTTSITGVGEVWELDLASFESVKKFAARVKKELGRVDGVIQNAGVGLDTWSVAEGHETSITVNVLSTTLLSILLLPKLKQSAKDSNILPRLVIVGSTYTFSFEAETEALKKGGLHSLDVESGSNMDARYAVTKMVGMFATFQIAKLLAESGNDAVVLNTVCPGLVKTSLGRNMNASMKAYLADAYKRYGREPAEGARAVLFAVSTGREGHGKYIADCKIKHEDLPVWWTDAEGVQLQEKLWKDIVGELETIAPGAVAEAL